MKKLEEAEDVLSGIVNKGIGKNVKTYYVSPKVQKQTDRISSLPDCLCLHILSFLNMSDVVNTSLLSTRWRYLWTSVSCLDFQIHNWDKETEKATFIDRTLFNHDGPKLQKLLFFFFYEDTDDLKVDSWIFYAIRHNVEELTLDLYNNVVVPEELWFSARYKLPHSLYNCTSLTSLKLSFCDLNLSASVQLSSLKTLDLELLDLSTKDITLLTSGCPLLEKLVLNGCNPYCDLNIIITNQNLKSLSIHDYNTVEAHTKVIICAPYLLTLFFGGFVLREKYCIKNMKSLKDVQFFEILKDVDEVYDGNKEHDVLIGLLRDLYYVEEMTLCASLVQVLSIRGMQEIHPLYFSTTRLKILTELTKWDLPGISYLLKSFPRLKTLVVEVPNSIQEMKLSVVFKDKFEFEEKGYWETEDYDFCSTLLNLESVKMYFLSGMQKYGNVEEDVQKLENKIAFAQFLLKNSNTLKKMTIKCGEDIQSNYELLSKLTENLVVFRRASPSAVIGII